jgi:hypothetical protein
MSKQVCSRDTFAHCAVVGSRSFVDEATSLPVQPAVDDTAAIRPKPASPTPGMSVVPRCFSTDVLLAAQRQFVATLKRVRLVEFRATAPALVRSAATDPIRPEARLLHVPDRPGLGIEPNYA